jgi:hypothetical protein
LAVSMRPLMRIQLSQWDRWIHDDTAEAFVKTIIGPQFL